ncbi:hypothetical protein SAMN04489727_7736 [Amycolatopsis tolypomycina]|uniref:Uncharacterized protein n=1 Tax=Amycolatopsis tolypomycina TaxID=208445 RepID=A0A1H5AFE1_9PSEU|nr:hypothetical protein SAMN04489727_7736 [Amycolatopsis tolypomycina]
MGRLPAGGKGGGRGRNGSRLPRLGGPGMGRLPGGGKAAGGWKGGPHPGQDPAIRPLRRCIPHVPFRLPAAQAFSSGA